jgi:SagB-type dehydrogenase family enzyme
LSDVDDGAQPRSTWRLIGTNAVERGERRITISHRFGTKEIRGTDQLCSLLHALCDDELDDGEIVAYAAATCDSEDSPPVGAVLANLWRAVEQLGDLVERSIYLGEELVTRITPISPRATTPIEAPMGPLILDRFSYLRVEESGNGVVLASPLALHRAILGRRMLAVAPEFASEGVDPVELSSELRIAAELLGGAGLLVPAGSQAHDARLATWAFHDVLFHGLSRPGRSDEPFGAHFAHGDIEPPPARVGRVGVRTALPAPDPVDVARRDPPIGAVLEARHSVRQWGESPPSVEQIGELLWRVQRAGDVVEIEGAPGYYGLARPYPTGGMTADLEIHLVISRCRGVEPGLYAYDGSTHELVREAELERADRLLEDARVAAGGQLDPPVLLVITSRFARISWKYERIAYALTLKHAGVLIQTLYLVATAMGLGVCALGSGDATASAEAFGLDWLVESSVGEMAVGVGPRLLEPRAAPPP